MRQGMLRRRAILSCLSHSHDQSSSQLYTQLNITVPILAVFFSGGDLKPAFRLSRESFNRLLALLPRQKAMRWRCWWQCTGWPVEHHTG
ncbi:unnamed protein product [Arctogadus glacialis]